MSIGVGVLLVAITKAAVTKGTDFFYYFCVSKLVALGHGGQIYDSRVLGALERHLASPLRVPGGLIPNVYPPFFAAALAPLAELPYSPAYDVWLLINCIALGLSLLYLERYAQLSRTGVIVFRIAALASLPVIVALLLGQVSLLMLALLCITFEALRTDRDRVAGVALGLTLIKPQYALAFLLVLVIGRRYQALLAFIATAVVLFLAPIVVLGWSTDVSYVRTLAHALGWGSSVGGFAPQVNRSFEGFARLLFPAAIATPLSILLDLIALGVLALAALRSRSLELLFALAVVVALLASQHVLIHDLTLLLIPAAIAWKFRAMAPKGTLILGAALYLSIYIGFSTSLTHRVQVPTVAMTAFGAWLFLIVLRTSSTPHPVTTGRVPAEGANLPAPI
jgi:alpha-1,2-mannosyltransferase